MTTETTRVSAESRIVFDPAMRPIVTARSGILCGCRFSLDAVTVRASAVTAEDGTITVHTALTPEVHGLVYNPGDEITRADWRLLTLDDSQVPLEAEEEAAIVVGAVYVLHPQLRYEDSPLARKSEAVAS
jgi:hypothetical protein